MEPENMNRREFLCDTAAETVGLVAASELLRAAFGAEPPGVDGFASRWHAMHDRVWIGPEYWANPLQDWRVAGGRLECVNAAPDRNVQLLTRELGPGPGDVIMSVRVGRVGGGALGAGRGSVGFRAGI